MKPEENKNILDSSVVVPEPEDYGAPVTTDDVNAFMALVQEAFAPLEKWYAGEDVDDLAGLIADQEAFYNEKAEPFRKLMKDAYVWTKGMEGAARRTKVESKAENDTKEQAHDRLVHGQIEYAIFRVNYCVERIMTAAHKATRAFSGLKKNTKRLKAEGRDPREIAWNVLISHRDRQPRGTGAFRKQQQMAAEA